MAYGQLFKGYGKGDCQWEKDFQLTQSDSLTPFFKFSLLGKMTLADGTQANGRVLTSDANGVASWSTTASIGAVPGGSNTDVQFNNSGAFGGSPALTWNGTALSILDTAPALVVYNSVTLTPDANILLGSSVSNGGLNYNNTANCLTVFNSAVERIIFAVGNINNRKMVIDNSGNVNIGTGSSVANPANKLEVNGQLAITTTTFIGGTSTPNSSAILQVSSTTQGFLPPVMTGTQRGAIATPAEGLIVYDTTAHKLYVQGQTTWEAITSV